jgi:hypothetical protein
MSRAGVMFGVAALAGLGIYAALPDDEPRYIGDMPSMLEQSEAIGSPAQPEPPDPPAPVAPRVDGPSPVGVEAPPAVGGGPGERVPDPVTDAARGYQGGGATGGGTDNPGPGIPDLLGGLPIDGLIPCVDTETILQAGVVIDCLTGLPVPDPPADPCTVVPLPFGCPPVVLPDVEVPVP